MASSSLLQLLEAARAEIQQGRSRQWTDPLAIEVAAAERGAILEEMAKLGSLMLRPSFGVIFLQVPLHAIHTIQTAMALDPFQVCVGASDQSSNLLLMLNDFMFPDWR